MAQPSATCIIGLRVHCLLTDILAGGGGGRAGQPPRAALSAGGIFLPAEFSAIQPCSEVILFTKINVF